MPACRDEDNVKSESSVIVEESITGQRSYHPPHRFWLSVVVAEGSLVGEGVVVVESATAAVVVVGAPKANDGVIAADRIAGDFGVAARNSRSNLPPQSLTDETRLIAAVAAADEDEDEFADDRGLSTDYYEESPSVIPSSSAAYYTASHLKKTDDSDAA
nr:hypothetical protein Iba_chr02bCG2460 [Ipomoea batatas]